MGKETYYLFLYKALDAVSETKYLLTYGKSNCLLTYKHLQELCAQVSVLKGDDRFKVRPDGIYFSYVFFNGQSYQTYIDKEVIDVEMSKFNFAIHCATKALLALREK